VSTPGIGAPHISPSQSNKVPAINSVFDLLDSALTHQSVIDVSGGADITPTPSAVIPFVSLRLVGALSANIHLVLPPSPHLWFVLNQATGGFTITIRCGAGSSVVLNGGDVKVIFCDSVNTITPN
jgi:hypothetical protein